MTALLALLLLAAPAEASTLIWLEAEHGQIENLRRADVFAPATDAEAAVLSGGAWVSTDDGAGLTITLEFDATGEKELFVRKFWKHGPFRWRIDDGPWTEVGRETALLDQAPLRPLLEASWVRAGTNADLPAGRHTLTLEVLPGSTAAAFDAVVLADPATFEPRGTLRPGGEMPSEPGKWAFSPEIDNFTADALLDLRPLNEDIAGQSGPIRLTADGNGFVLGDGTPVDFWAVTTYAHRIAGLDGLQRQAKVFAKRGVNMVRLHTQLPTNLEEIDPTVQDAIWRTVAAMKKEGIYVTVSIYWSHATEPGMARELGYDDWPDDLPPYGLLFFDEPFQAAYRGWWEQLLSPENPYTGVPLSDDPALAVCQLQNEDSLLFWTTERIQGKARLELRQQFGVWLEREYGDLASARRAWQNATDSADDWPAKTPALLTTWELTQTAGTAQSRRVADQLRFYGELMRGFNKAMTAYLKDELGFDGLVNAGNWKTADGEKLRQIERWSYLGGDIVATNRYYNEGTHAGPRASFSVSVGDFFEGLRLEDYPGRLPTAMVQQLGAPALITESNVGPPLGERAGAPLMLAAQMAAGGVDGYYWFAAAPARWSGAPTTKFETATPDLLGMFPAAALMLRQNLIDEAEPLKITRQPEALWLRLPLPVSEAGGFDPIRDEAADTAVAADALLHRPVLIEYADADAVNDPPIDSPLTYDRGRFTVDAPRCQLATGTIGRVALSDVTLDVGNDYAAVAVVPLDGKPIAESGKVLVQIGTVARLTGFATEPATHQAGDNPEITGHRITALGQWPWQLEHATGTVSVGNPNLTQATALDPNGYPLRELGATRAGNTLTFELPPDALYVVLR
jgi:hypothetical protein